MIKRITVLAASFCVGLGILGIFLPLLPTTPFLLLAIFLYMRSSREGVKRILRNRYLAPYVHSYFSKEGLPDKVLFRILILMWGSMLCCILFATRIIYIRILLFVIAICVTIHLYCRSTRRIQQRDKDSEKVVKSERRQKKSRSA